MSLLLDRLTPSAKKYASAYKFETIYKRRENSAEFDPIPHINPAYRPHLHNVARIQIFFGGSSSGKSVFAVGQRTVYDMLQGGRNYLICRAVAKDSRRSTFVEVQKVINEWGLKSQFKINKTDLTITHNNGYQILFTGLDDTEKLKSITPLKGAITDVIVEEATQAKQDDIRQLLRRQRGGDTSIKKRLTLLFNPILKSSWIFKQYFSGVWSDDSTFYEGDGLTILKTTYKDNEFLAQDEIDILENEPDEYWYEVYTLGNWGTLGDVIFRNWKSADLSNLIPQFDNMRFGLDFGFSSDPAAMVATHYDKARKTIYIFDEVYERGLTNDVLAGIIRPIVKDNYIACDSSEPKSIEDLKREGLGATPSRKGRDSINHGIDWLMRQSIVIHKSCVHVINEFETYQWKKDRDGNSMRTPIDKNNHAIDALRYAYESESLESWGMW